MFGLVVLLVAASPAAASDMMPAPDFAPVFKPTLAVNRTTTDIDIDGNLDDAGWTSAVRTDRFVERDPGDMVPPQVRTEVLVTYDDKNLYVGFICHDDPKAIRATMAQRDHWGGDDCVIVMIDTYGDASVAYEFFVNPYGVQRDHLWTPTIGEDASFDLIWNSAAKITATGYQVEIAIPFSGIRFPGRDAQEWKMDFWRNRPRESQYQYSWAAYNRGEQCWPCQWGTVTGISDVQPGKGVELLASVVGNQSGQLNYDGTRFDFDNADVDGDLSLGGKYAITSGMTVEATYNPDYSQIEADAAQIDVNSTISLFYPERRPFFQEGSDIFRTLFNSFYTRTVNDPDYAVKSTGRVGRATIGFISAKDNTSPYALPFEEFGGMIDAGESYVNVLRGALSFGQNDRAGFMITDRRFEHGGYGTILSADGQLRLSQNYSVVGQFVGSFTGEPDQAMGTEGLEGLTFDGGKHTAILDGESYSGTALITQFRRNGRHLNVRLNFDQVAPTYRTQTGYDPWNDYRNGFAVTSYTFYSDKGLIQRITPSFYAERRWNYDGKIKWSHATAGLDANLRFWQTYAGLQYTVGSENWSGVQYDDLWTAQINLGNQINDALGFNFNYQLGRGVARRLGESSHEIGGGIGMSVKPIDRLTIEPSFSFARATSVTTDEELYEQHITRTRFQLQANRELSVRLVVQYNDGWETWDVDPLLTYQISPFSVFYIGSTYDYGNMTAGLDAPSDWRLTNRQFFMKIQYLFQT